MKFSDLDIELANTPTEEEKRTAKEMFRIKDNIPIRKIKLPNRNDPCPCGSGKKYKNCCMETDKKIIENINRNEYIRNN